MGVRLIRSSPRERQVVYDAVDAYVEWREAAAAVSESYGRWGKASAEDAVRAHADYRTALDREEATADVYAELIERVGNLLEAG
jgi:hypothetical protein